MTKAGDDDDDDDDDHQMMESAIEQHLTSSASTLTCKHAEGDNMTGTPNRKGFHVLPDCNMQVC